MRKADRIWLGGLLITALCQRRRALTALLLPMVIQTTKLPELA
jgi:hypothetical protein